MLGELILLANTTHNQRLALTPSCLRSPRHASGRRRSASARARIGRTRVTPRARARPRARAAALAAAMARLAAAARHSAAPPHQRQASRTRPPTRARAAQRLAARVGEPRTGSESCGGIRNCMDPARVACEVTARRSKGELLAAFQESGQRLVQLLV